MGSHDTKPTPDDKLAVEISKFFYDPLGYVMFSFPWDTDKSIQLVELESPYKERFGCTYGPDVWACEFLDEWGEDIKANNFNGRDAVPPLQYVTASGHGIGKSTLAAWIIKFIMDTRPLSKGTVTANTAEQLKTKTWAELGKWHNRSLTRHWFDYSSGRGAMALRSNRTDSYGNSLREEWFCTAQTCREENSEAFAGQHAPNATSFYLFDEGSAVPDKIYEVREGGTTDGEPMTFDFGNPTRNSGRFYEECIGKLKHRYKIRCIDSRNVKITNKERIQQWEEDYGEDSDFFKVRVKGEFPSAGSTQFIPTEAVMLAQAREITTDRFAPLVIGVDVARFGDDESVIYPRIGDDCRTYYPTKQKGRYLKLDTVQLTGKVIECVRDFRSMGLEASAIFVDGGGIGGGVVDQLRHLGYNVTEIQFGSGPTDKTFRYKSDELWGNLKSKLGRISLPNCTDLRNQLTQREFGYTLTGNKIHLETKRDMKERLGGDHASPDIADALALTYSEEVAPLDTPIGQREAHTTAMAEYDPLDPPACVG